MALQRKKGLNTKDYDTEDDDDEVFNEDLAQAEPMLQPPAQPELEQLPRRRLLSQPLVDPYQAQVGLDGQEPISLAGTAAWCGLAMTVFCLATLSISLASPFWLQTYPASFNTFQNIGLWEVCFDGFMHPKDDASVVYNGCWWVYQNGLIYSRMRQWLMPPWFRSCQVIVIASLLFGLAALSVVVAVFLHLCPVVYHEYHQVYALYAASSLMFLITTTTFIVVVLFGFLCQDRNWLPRPDLNFLSWGYGFLVITFLASVPGGICYYLEAQKTYNELLKRENQYVADCLEMADQTRLNELEEVTNYEHQMSMASMSLAQHQMSYSTHPDFQLPDDRPSMF